MKKATYGVQVTVLIDVDESRPVSQERLAKVGAALAMMILTELQENSAFSDAVQDELGEQTDLTGFRIKP